MLTRLLLATAIASAGIGQASAASGSGGAEPEATNKSYNPDEPSPQIKKTKTKKSSVQALPNDAPLVTKSEPEPAAAASDGKFTLGGAVRFRWDTRFNDAHLNGDRNTSNHFSFDTIALKAKYDSSTFFASGQYRIYGGSFIYGKRNGYDKHVGEVHFPMWGYAGYKFTPQDSVTAGINQTPFGLTPYFGSSFLESLGFTAGLEEVYNVGVKYSHADEEWTWDIGYYPGAAPEGKGISRDSARYSTNIVRADGYVPNGTDNHERNMVVGRVEHTFLKTDVASFTGGLSGWVSQIHNFDTGKDGTKTLASVHFNATYGNWGFKGIYVRQDIRAKNPGRDDIITIGGYDASYNIATKGNLVSGEINYKIPDDIGPFSVQPYLNYSAFIKDKSSFKTSQRYILGAAWTFTKDPKLVIYSEGILGKNDPYVGAGQFVSGLAQGGDDKWKKSIIVNIGYYF